jgi:hypothetical protein
LMACFALHGGLLPVPSYSWLDRCNLEMLNLLTALPGLLVAPSVCPSELHIRLKGCRGIRTEPVFFGRTDERCFHFCFFEGSIVFLSKGSIVFSKLNCYSSSSSPVRLSLLQSTASGSPQQFVATWTQLA